MNDNKNAISKEYILNYLKVFVREELYSSFTEVDGCLYVKFVNGQEFKISVQEIL